MRFAYADPPYPGNAHRYPEKQEVDHEQLIAHLATYDGWALSTSTKALRDILPLCPPGARIAAWTKPFSFSFDGINGNPLHAWEPVIYFGWRKRAKNQIPVHDWLKTWPERDQEVLGQKPPAFSFWLFDLLNTTPDDSLDDLFPGSGAVTRAWHHWTANYHTRLFSPTNNPNQEPLIEA